MSSMLENIDDATTERSEPKLPLTLPTRIIAYAWGEKYIGELLSITVPALLAPGNLPYVAGQVPCELVILSEEASFPRFRADPAIVRIAEFCPVRLVALDDLIPAPDKYGIALTHVLHRGFSDLGPAMTDTWLMFLNADFVLADGSLRSLLRYLASGERLVASPSYCVNTEPVVPELLRRVNARTFALSLPNREMAELILRHRHNTIRAKTVNQSELSIRHMDQFYWLADANTLLGHQMPIAIVGMRPERYVAEPNSYWDHGLMREFFPTAEHCVIGDSDEFLMLELRGSDVAREQLQPGWPDPAEIARNTISFMTAYQRDMARYPLSLHSGDVPVGIDEARRELRSFVDTVLSHLPAKLPSHLNHPQWNYHWPWFIEARHQHLSRQLGAITETAAPPAAFGELDRLWWKLDGLKKSHARQREELERLLVSGRDAVARLQENTAAGGKDRENDITEQLVRDLMRARQETGSNESTTCVAQAIRQVSTIDVAERSADLDAVSAQSWLDAERAWATLQSKLQETDRLVTQALASIEKHYNDRLFSLDQEFEASRAPLEAEYDRRVTTRKIAGATVPHIELRRGARLPAALAGGSRVVDIGRLAYSRLFGRAPEVRRSHPYWAPLRHVRRIVAQAAAEGAADVLVVLGMSAMGDPLSDTLPGLHARVVMAEILQGNLPLVLEQTRQFDLCICTLGPAELDDFAAVVEIVTPFMREDGRIVGFCPNFDVSPIPPETTEALANLRHLPGAVRCFISGSPRSERVLRRFRAALTAARRGRLSVLVAAARFIVVFPSALLANRVESGAGETNPDLLPNPWTSITIETVLSSGEVMHSATGCSSSARSGAAQVMSGCSSEDKSSRRN